MKREEKLFDAITDVRDDLLEEALNYRFRSRRSAWRRWANVAACLVLVLGTMTFFRVFGSKGGSDNAKSEVLFDGDMSVSESVSDNKNKGDAAGGDEVPRYEAADDSAADGSDSGATQMPEALPWHEGLVLAVEPVEGDFADLVISRDLYLFGGSELLVEDVYTFTSAEEQTITLLCPVVSYPGSFEGLRVAVNGREEAVKGDPLLVSRTPGGESVELFADDRAKLDDGTLWVFRTRVELPLAAGETTEFRISYTKPMVEKVELPGDGIQPDCVTPDGVSVLWN